ncbi:MAG: serine hydrolase [Simkaniaceae bacterium]|nr:serine hydrolase [Simkaniaceae bacterium]
MRVWIVLCLASCHLFGKYIDPLVMRDLVERYNDTDSDAMLVMQDGTPILQLGKIDVPFETMSITKSMVGLAIGILIDQGKIPSINTPVSFFFPEWNAPLKCDVTIKHLLSHTAGIESYRTLEEAYLIPDHLQSALDSNIIDPPGTRFAYSQKGVNLLSGIVEKITGEPLDVFVEKMIFDPLGIGKDYYWNRDFAGHTIGMYGLEMSAEHLAKIGQLMLNEGMWNGERIISAEWVQLSMIPSQSHHVSCGLLWWLDREHKVSWPQELIREYRLHGMDEGIVSRLEQVGPEGMILNDHNLLRLLGSREFYERFMDQIEENNLKRFDLKLGEVRGARAEGYLGQYILIIPKHKIVAVRLIKFGKVAEGVCDYFKDFIDLVHKLVNESQ